MTRYTFAFVLIAAAAAAACDDTPPNPAPLDVPRTDTGADTDAAPVDSGMDAAPPDTSPPQDTGTGTPDATPPRDVPEDVRFGMAFCDLPMPPSAMVPGATVPEGFCIRKFHGGRQGTFIPRVVAFAPNGDVFVASPSTPTPGGSSPGLGEILVLPDDDQNGVADSAMTYANNLDSVMGLLFANDHLYYSLADGVYRVPYRAGDRRFAGTLPEDALVNLFDRDSPNRWTHTISQDAAGRLYVSRGIYDSSTCPNPEPRSGAVLRFGPGHDPRGDIVARGFRNPMYVRCQPWGTCYAAELTGDGWGTLGQEKIVELRDGDDYGYPCCYDRMRPVMPAWERFCTGVMSGVTGFPVGHTPFGHDYEKGGWPAPYGGGLFVGLHGVVGSWAHTGLVWAPTDPTTHRPTRMPETFVGGWSQAGPVRGRIADVVFAPDGRMFFTDDTGAAGGAEVGPAVYWVAHRSQRVRLR